MGRLVVVSNRVADLTVATQSGGLAVALRDAILERGGVWFGWNGTIAEKAGEPPVREDYGHVSRVSLSLTRRDYREYYLGYANSVLWPLFHYRLDLVDFRRSYFEGYMRVNRNFARQIAPFLQPDDTIWVHDYHLIPLARQLRQAGCRQRIGFFLHIPFPPPDMLAASPNHAELVRSLMEYDVVGFQTSTDVGNLRRYLEQHPVVELTGESTARLGGREVRFERFPIGIDADVFSAMAEENMTEDIRIDAMRRSVFGRKQVIGVDRLDYSKGLPERMKAFRRMLEMHPEMEKAVSFLQIAPPTREEVNAYTDIRKELEGLSGAINGELADFNWTPIRYIHRNVPREKLSSLFRTSHAALVTPLRDGMNLVAKEYVAAQDPDDPGVLILSQFAGAAEEMTSALIVNPYDIDDMARRLYDALTMPLEERQRRHRDLLDHVRRQDSRAWLESFLAVLEDRKDANSPTLAAVG
jgi:trehalose 6-phosphate synthase